MKALHPIIPFFSMLIIAFFLPSCTQNKEKPPHAEGPTTPTVTITKSIYGSTADGQKVEKYSLLNQGGMEVDIITYGGIITSLRVPDKEGRFQNVVLNFENLEQYLDKTPYFGALIGRYGNRIANGQFELDGKTYTLATNNPPNHLHGGVKGFDKVVWKAEVKEGKEEASLMLSYLSKDLEEGYPGKLMAEVTYTLDNENNLSVAYAATTDKKTIVNMTQHAYFNLSGDFDRDILDHELLINADQYLPVDPTMIPTGEFASVEGTPFDFRKRKAIGDDIEANHPQIATGHGYDHCWILNDQGTLRKIASVYHPTSGRRMEVSTTEPGVQLYTANFLGMGFPKPGGGTYERRTAFCLETQHYPDSPNREEFPSTVLEPGQRYESQTVFSFGVK